MSDNRLIGLRFPVALVLSIVCLASPAWADFKAGENAYHRSDYATALREWQPLAKQGHAAAQYHPQRREIELREIGVVDQRVEQRVDPGERREAMLRQAMPLRSTILACSMPTARGSQKTMPKLGSGTRKPPSKDTCSPRSTWGAYMIMVVVVRRISRWL